MTDNEKTNAANKRHRRRERVLRTVSVLPTLATLGNLVCGLGAIYLCMLSVLAGGDDLATPTMGSERINSVFPTFLAIAAYLLVLSMAFDGIDGALARLTRRTSEFGGQLDSLSDIVSFGVAPAILVLCLARPDAVGELSSWERLYWRAEWVMAATYVCCAALRLARFNVENDEDESAHMGFRGLPTPGAACALVGAVILHQDLLRSLLPDVAPGWTAGTLEIVAKLLPPFAMILGLLMVSRFQYVHIVNATLRRRRPFRQVVAIVIALLVGLVIQFQLTIALAAAAYALSGPILRIIHRARGQSEVNNLPPPSAPDMIEEIDDIPDDTPDSTGDTEAGDPSHESQS